MIHHGQTYRNLMHDLRSCCVWIAGCSLLANFLPNAKLLRPWPRVCQGYLYFVDFVACCALNFRVCIPSLDGEFMGFKRRARYAYRNWRQNRLDRRI